MKINLKDFITTEIDGHEPTLSDVAEDLVLFDGSVYEAEAMYNEHQTLKHAELLAYSLAARKALGTVAFLLVKALEREGKSTEVEADLPEGCGAHLTEFKPVKQEVLIINTRTPKGLN